MTWFPSAKTLAEEIIEHFILKYGSMIEIRGDMGSEYVNQVPTRK